MKKKKLIPTKRKKVKQDQINKRVTAELIDMINKLTKKQNEQS